MTARRPGLRNSLIRNPLQLFAAKGGFPLFVGDACLDELALPCREIRHGVLDQFAVLLSIDLLLSNGNILSVDLAREGRLSGDVH